MQLEDKYFLYKAELSDINDNKTIEDNFQVVLCVKPEDGDKKTPYSIYRKTLKRSLTYLGLASPSLYGVSTSLHSGNPLIFIIGYKRTALTSYLFTYFLTIGNKLDPKEAKFPWLKDIAYSNDPIKPKNKYKTLEDTYYEASPFWLDYNRR